MTTYLKTDTPYITCQFTCYIFPTSKKLQNLPSFPTVKDDVETIISLAIWYKNITFLSELDIFDIWIKNFKYFERNFYVVNHTT